MASMEILKKHSNSGNGDGSWSLDLNSPWCMEIGDMKLHTELSRFASEKVQLGTKIWFLF